MLAAAKDAVVLADSHVCRKRPPRNEVASKPGCGELWVLMSVLTKGLAATVRLDGIRWGSQAREVMSQFAKGLV